MMPACPSPDDRGAVVRHARRPRRRRARRADRRGLATDLPDLDVRAGRRSASRGAATSTRGRRTRPASASSGRSRRSRAGAHGIAFASGLRGDRGDRRAGRPGRRDRRRRRRLRRHVPLPRAGPPAGGGVDVDATSTSPAGPDVLWEALSERTRLVWFETPTNPLLKIVDIAAVAATVGATGRRGGPTAADRGRQHVRLARHPAAARRSVPTSSSTRPRSTWPGTPTRSSGSP